MANAATCVPQLLLWVKSAAAAPVMVMPPTGMFSGPLPELLRVITAGVEAAPNGWGLVKVRLVAGESVTSGAVPIPRSEMLCGELAALLLTVRVASRLPVAVGVKLTLTVQYGTAGASALVPETLVPQVLVWVKSPAAGPPIATLCTLNAKGLRFCSVTAWAGLVDPTLVPVNVKLGARVLVAPADPLNVMGNGMFVPLPFTVRVPVRVPGRLGSNTTCTLQEVEGVRTMGSAVQGLMIAWLLIW